MNFLQSRHSAKLQLREIEIYECFQKPCEVKAVTDRFGSVNTEAQLGGFVRTRIKTSREAAAGKGISKRL